MLQAIPKALFSRGFTVVDGAQTVADLERSWWTERGVLTVQGAPFKVYREGMIFGPFLLETEEAVVARAALKTRLFGNAFAIEHAGMQYSLRTKGKGCTLLNGLGEKIGALYSDSGRGTKIDLPDELPLVVRVFVFWLALNLWKLESE